MDRSPAFIVLLVGAVVSSPVDFSGSVLDHRVRPGDNVTFYCGCKTDTGEFIVWRRNCSHLHQPTLHLTTRYPKRDFNVGFNEEKLLHPFPRLRLLWNNSSTSFDLLIANVTQADEGLYYCESETQPTGTDLTKLVKRDNQTNNLSVAAPHTKSPHSGCAEHWRLLLILCPALSLLSSVLSSVLVYSFCKKTVNQTDVDQKSSESRDRTGAEQDEDVCYAALEIRQKAQRPKKKALTSSPSARSPSSDFCTYSAINTSRM